MNVTQTALRGVLLPDPKVFGDARGFSLETYLAERSGFGLSGPFVPLAQGFCVTSDECDFSTRAPSSPRSRTDYRTGNVTVSRARPST